MRIAVLTVVCNGEEELALDTLECFRNSCDGAELHLFVVDDASDTRIGERLAKWFGEQERCFGYCLTMDSKLGLRGMAERLYVGLEMIANSGIPFDAIVKIDPDVFPLRRDFLSFIRKTCLGHAGLFGERYFLRKRDAVLVLLDLVPLGFRRKTVNGMMQRRWELRRFYPVWWMGAGLQSLFKGYRLDYIGGCFWILSPKTLEKLISLGYVSRFRRARQGLVFGDDVTLTMAVYAIGHPVVDLQQRSPHWGGTTRMSEETPVEKVVEKRPYVVHPLKQNTAAWERRGMLRSLFSLEPQTESSDDAAW